MAKQTLSLGQQANDGSGDGLRTGGDKINDNFNEVYSLLGDGDNLLNTDIDFGPNKLLYSNVVSTEADLNNINPSTYHGMTMHVHSTGALFYAHAGVWRKLLTDNSNGNVTSYSDSLATLAYSGDYNDLLNRPIVPTTLTDLSDIEDGSAGQALTTDGAGRFVFRDIEATSVEFGNVTNRPTTLAGYGIQDAFSGDYNDLDNRPVLFSGSYNDLTNKPTIPTDINQLGDDSNLLFDGTYSSLDGRPVIPADVEDLTDDTNLLFSGDYGDLDNKPTSFSSLNSLSMALGVNIDEFSNDTTLTDSSETALVTEFAVKNYVDSAVSGVGIALNDLGVVVNSVGTADLDYNNETGIFTYTPPDLSTYLTSVAWDDLTGTPTSIGFSVGESINEFSSDTTLAGNSDSAVPTEAAVKAYVDDAIASFDSVGNFTLGSSIIDTDDSSAITITPAVTMSSDLTVQNDLVVNGALKVDEFQIIGTGSFDINATTDVNLTAGNKVKVTGVPFRLGRLTTSERDALIAENGDMIYNTTLEKFQGYQNGAWINLDGT